MILFHSREVEGGENGAEIRGLKGRSVPWMRFYGLESTVRRVIPVRKSINVQKGAEMKTACLV
jgi:hypothetical protein